MPYALSSNLLASTFFCGGGSSSDNASHFISSVQMIVIGASGKKGKKHSNWTQANGKH